MLLVGDVPVTAAPGELLEAVLLNPEVERQNRMFLEQSRGEVPAHKSSLCVLQGEEALVDPVASVEYLGSEDATTCVLVVVHCSTTRRSWAAHLDEISGLHSSQMWENLDDFKAPSLYLVGGYREPKNQGPALAGEVLSLFHSTDQRFDLKLACVASAVTEHDGRPACRQLVVELATGRPFPLTFADRGPEVERRMAGRWCQGTCRLANIWDPDCRCLDLPHFVCHLPQWLCTRSRRLLGLADAELLQVCSTSPLHESENFVADMRALHRWLIDAQDQPGDYPPHVQYRWHTTGWVRADKGGGVDGVRPWSSPEVQHTAAGQNYP